MPVNALIVTHLAIKGVRKQVRISALLTTTVIPVVGSVKAPAQSNARNAGADPIDLTS